MSALLKVWSAGRPCHEVHRIPAGGLIIGRRQASDDPEISSKHLEIVANTNDGGRLLPAFFVTDLGSQNGSRAGLRPISTNHACSSNTVIRTGQTIWVTTTHPTTYELTQTRRLGPLVIRGSLGPIVDALLRADREESCLTVYGPIEFGVKLVTAQLPGATVVRTTSPLAPQLEAGPRRVIFAVDRVLEGDDARELAAWLETDVQFITVTRQQGLLNALPRAVTDKLMLNDIELPRVRRDELPTEIADLVEAASPGTPIDASLIEHAITFTFLEHEDEMRARIRAVLRDQDPSEREAPLFDDVIRSDASTA